ncbi:MAG TPA: DUF1549 domain-containing protein, partial [Armatimonadota bacterium]|nr:DUF1549 domain-containing protein [Armatimonadota bacterium]
MRRPGVPFCIGLFALELALLLTPLQGSGARPGRTAAISKRVSAPAAPRTPLSRSDSEFFEREIRPVLAEHCYSCHSAKVAQGGLRVDSRAALLKGGARGPALVPQRPDKSSLVLVLRHTGPVKMPPQGKLPDKSIDALSRWVAMGAPWPAASVSAPGARTAAAVGHWAFRPVKKPAVPVVNDRAWVKSPIDAFVLARLERKALKPSPLADRRTLIRRAAFDLTGLPPTPGEVEAFVSDRSPDAWPKVVERLLASPHYGERWGRYWLDVARYADTKGYVFFQDGRFPWAYTYRDYVIRAFNEDLPYNRFLLEQLAADQLPLGEDRRPLAAMGFLTVGGRFMNNSHDILDDRI